MFSVAGLPTWTIDGISLNSLSFIYDIEGGQPLINDNDKNYPIFNLDMLPTELTDLFESTVAIAFDGNIVEKGVLRPVKIGDPKRSLTLNTTT